MTSRTPGRLTPLLFTLASCAALAAVGAGCARASPRPPSALLHPAKLKVKAPRLYTVTFRTTKGTFTIRVHRTWAPHAADRFYNLVRAHFFDGAEFFRVIPNFVVQFGISPYPAVSKAWEHATIPDDPTVGIPNRRGAVSFASAGPNTRTTQVFIDTGNNQALDQEGFTPFGAVGSGLDVVDMLYSGYGDRPTPQQVQMMAQGNAFLKKRYPKLDSIKTARVTNGT